MISCLAFATWLWILLFIGFNPALSSGKSRCWPCFLVAKTTSAACWCACCKTVPRFDGVPFFSPPPSAQPLLEEYGGFA